MLGGRELAERVVPYWLEFSGASIEKADVKSAGRRPAVHRQRRKERFGGVCQRSAIVLRSYVGTGDIFANRLLAGPVLLKAKSAFAPGVTVRPTQLRAATLRRLGGLHRR